MKVWTRIKKLSIAQAWKLSVLFLKHPRLLFPTLLATKRTFAICNTLFGNKHHKSNKANAFRHALWNVQICEKSHKTLKNKQKSAFWAQKVTTLYEKVTQNSAIDEAMDLHNNAMGRLYFFNLLGQNETKMSAFIQEKAKKAIKVNVIEDISKVNGELVFIEE